MPKQFLYGELAEGHTYTIKLMYNYEVHNEEDQHHENDWEITVPDRLFWKKTVDNCKRDLELYGTRSIFKRHILKGIDANFSENVPTRSPSYT